MKKTILKRVLIISVVMILICACLYGLLAVASRSVIGVVERIQGNSILITVAHPTLFWLDPDIDDVWLTVDKPSKHRVGDVIYAFSGSVMLDTDPPQVGTKWVFRIVRQDFRY